MVLALALAATSALAAPEDRGARGWWISGGVGGGITNLAADDGRDAGSAVGTSARLRVGEEVLPGLNLGLAVTYLHGAAESALFTAKQGSLLVDVNWQPWPTLVPPLVIEAGMGFGVGQLTPNADAQADEVYKGSSAGAAWVFGAAYAFEPAGATQAGGWTLAPTALLYWLPAQNGSPTRMVTVVLGLEGTWFFGR